MSLFSNFPQGGKKAGVQSISDGGTGATTAEAALANLGGFPKADGEALKTRIQPINLGGTGASEANEARQNLGAAAVKEMTKAEYDTLPAIDPTIFYALTDVEADGVKIEVGSYVGTGTIPTKESPLKLTFSFAPKVLIVKQKRPSSTGIGDGLMIAFHTDTIAQTSQNTGSSPNYKAVNITFSGNQVSWYTVNSSKAGASESLNYVGYTYNYIAIS